MAIEIVAAAGGGIDSNQLLTYSCCCTSTLLVNETEEDMVVREEFELDAQKIHASPSYITRYIIPSKGHKTAQVPWSQRLTTDDDPSCIRFRIFAKSKENHCDSEGDNYDKNIGGGRPRRSMISWRRFLSIPCFGASSGHSAAASSTDSSTNTGASSTNHAPPHHFKVTRLCFNARDLSCFTKIAVVSLPSGEYGLVKHLPC